MSLEGFSRITPFLWFDANADEAVEFYLGIFANSRRLGELKTPDGKVLTCAFELDGQKFTALNGGPAHTFNEAVSFVVRCEDQAEIDFFWTRLAEGGAEIQCGWLKDKFGLRWQVVPARLGELLRNPAAMQAMMGMKKLVIADLECAAGS
jgi:predicted 3-demethylubiquinone-9 3-methyltransferase (glyoxalase superfamily)